MRMFYAKTISHTLEQASVLLSEVTGTPRLESEILLAFVMQCSRVYLLTHPDHTLSDQQVHQYVVCVGRRVNNEPLPYITGTIEFCGMQFVVTPDVLIPRPETEQLVEVTTTWLSKRRHAVVLDAGTGSGCIAVSLARYAQYRYILATDISMPALRVARENAEKHKVLEKIGFVNCDLLHSIRYPVDVIVSNPPYIADHEYTELPPSIHYEPRVALFAGIDGLQVVQKLIQQAKEILDPYGLLLVEIGDKQGKAASAIAKAAFPDAYIDILHDLAGLDRTLYIECSGSD